MNESRKILMDMDIGDDIDDALALYTAMREGFDLIGVTTVFRNTVQRARQARKLMTDYGHGYESVPVYAGHSHPIGKTVPDDENIPHYTKELEEDRYAPTSTNPDAAVDFIIDACNKYGKSLTVIAIGPFTNIARVIEKDPTALNKAGCVAIMGGAYFRQYADWNVINDVPAAALMFEKLDNLACVGADVTHLAVGDKALYDDLLDYKGSDPARLYLKELCRLWRADRPDIPFFLHDPLVVCYLADPDILTMQSASILVFTQGAAKGLTFNVDAYARRDFAPEAYEGFDETRKTSVAREVDVRRFNERLLRDFEVVSD